MSPAPNAKPTKRHIAYEYRGHRATKRPPSHPSSGGGKRQKAGQVEPHFLPALVPLCQSIADLLILSIQLVLIRYRFDRITLLCIEDLALVDMW